MSPPSADIARLTPERDKHWHLVRPPSILAEWSRLFPKIILAVMFVPLFANATFVGAETTTDFPFTTDEPSGTETSDSNDGQLPKVASTAFIILAIFFVSTGFSWLMKYYFLSADGACKLDAATVSPSHERKGSDSDPADVRERALQAALYMTMFSKGDESDEEEIRQLEKEAQMLEEQSDAGPRKGRPSRTAILNALSTVNRAPKKTENQGNTIWRTVGELNRINESEKETAAKNSAIKSQTQNVQSGNIILDALNANNSNVQIITAQTINVRTDNDHAKLTTVMVHRSASPVISDTNSDRLVRTADGYDNTQKDLLAVPGITTTATNNSVTQDERVKVDDDKDNCSVQIEHNQEFDAISLHSVTSYTTIHTELELSLDTRRSSRSTTPFMTGTPKETSPEVTGLHDDRGRSDINTNVCTKCGNSLPSTAKGDGSNASPGSGAHTIVNVRLCTNCNSDVNSTAKQNTFTVTHDRHPTPQQSTGAVAPINITQSNSCTILDETVNEASRTRSRTENEKKQLPRDFKTDMDARGKSRSDTLAINTNVETRTVPNSSDRGTATSSKTLCSKYGVPFHSTSKDDDRWASNKKVTTKGLYCDKCDPHASKHLNRDSKQPSQQQYRVPEQKLDNTINSDVNTNVRQSDSLKPSSETVNKTLGNQLATDKGGNATFHKTKPDSEEKVKDPYSKYAFNSQLPNQLLLRNGNVADGRQQQTPNDESNTPSSKITTETGKPSPRDHSADKSRRKSVSSTSRPTTAKKQRRQGVPSSSKTNTPSTQKRRSSTAT